ncbi:collagen alpha-1(I) chain-like [Equus przewalskii]|uniref:Collagen alpha-1(I) chain-like n=1 Tax=Equus przewalskii TaxID=9798 RepID=A0ABM4NKN8_EQUPR
MEQNPIAPGDSPVSFPASTQSCLGSPRPTRPCGCDVSLGLRIPGGRRRQTDKIVTRSLRDETKRRVSGGDPGSLPRTGWSRSLRSGVLREAGGSARPREGAASQDRKGPQGRGRRARAGRGAGTQGFRPGGVATAAVGPPSRWCRRLAPPQHLFPGPSSRPLSRLLLSLPWPTLVWPWSSATQSPAPPPPGSPPECPPESWRQTDPSADLGRRAAQVLGLHTCVYAWCAPPGRRPFTEVGPPTLHSGREEETEWRRRALESLRGLAGILGADPASTESPGNAGWPGAGAARTSPADQEATGVTEPPPTRAGCAGDRQPASAPGGHRRLLLLESSGSCPPELGPVCVGPGRPQPPAGTRPAGLQAGRRGRGAGSSPFFLS